MTVKSVLKSIVISILITIVLMFLMYDFNVNYVSLSNVLFIVGLTYFFPGVIVVSGASDLFSSFGYLTRRMVFKPKGDATHFKSFGDYMEYKNAQKAGNNLRGKGLDLLIIGILYVVISNFVGNIV